MTSRRDFHKLSIAAAAAALSAQASAQTPPRMPAAAVPPPPEPEPTMRPEIVGSHGIVAAGRHYTVEAGMRILAAGGNAFDAGVAAVFAAAVNEISHFGLGGEAPVVLYEAGNRKVTVVSGQGPAPMAATPAYFAPMGLIPGNGPNAGTVPAVVDSMALTLQNFGTKSLAEVLQPAIDLADGFPMYAWLRKSLVNNRANTVRWEWARRTYYPNDHLTDVGEMFRQPNLAATLRAIAAGEQAALKKGANRDKAIEAGRDAFYKGDVARRMAAAVQADGGLLSYEDLARYKGRLEAAVSTRFMGYEIHKPGFWSQGPVLLMMLNTLEAAGIDKMRPGSEQYLHTLIETLKLSLDDRNAWFGDPLFADIPAAGLLSKSYAAERAAQIGQLASLEHRFGNPYAHQQGGRAPATPFVPHRQSRPSGPVGDTTAIEVVDAKGNLFSCTPSSGWLAGGAYIAGDTGVPMSNRLTVFDLDPASPNVLVGGKRPRTTLSPSIVTRDGKPFLAIGTPGADSQDQQILQVLLYLMVGGMDLQHAVEAPRVDTSHMHQSFGDKRDEPGALEAEMRIPLETLQALVRRGHRIGGVGDYGIASAMVAAGVDPKAGTLRGSADVRGERYAFGW